MGRKQIAIIGGGPAGMIAADMLAPECDVVIYEQGKTIGRKFLVAGQGGFNLTNSATGLALKAVYSPPGFLDEALDAFGPGELRSWLEELGIPTYVGTSGRVFPNKGIKPIEVLSRMREDLTKNGVRIAVEHAFIGFDAELRPIIEKSSGRTAIHADHVIFALGGASWPVTGSGGTWTEHFAAIGVETAPWRSSNCGVMVQWPAEFARDHAGKPLKNIRVTTAEGSVLGEATITAHGLEGNAIYPVVPALRSALELASEATLYLDLKPNNSVEQLLDKVRDGSALNYASALNLDRSQLALLKACTSKEIFLDPILFVPVIKRVPIGVTGLRPIEEAISSVGGIRAADLNEDFSLQARSSHFAVGEMVDWDAPTGGFLLQGCFSMGHHAARSILRRS